MWLRRRGKSHDVPRCTIERLYRDLGIEGARRGGKKPITTQQDKENPRAGPPRHPGAEPETRSTLSRGGVVTKAIGWSLQEEAPILLHAVKALVRRLSKLRAETARPGGERQGITDCESVPAPGERQSQTWLPPDELARLVAGYRSERTVYQFAGEFKIARQTVSEHLHRHGVPMRRQGLTDDQVLEAIRLRKQGLTPKMINVHFEVSIDTVRDRLRRRGVATDRPA
jgi:hypothetical protein